jgi:hypothetical protein
MGASAWRWRSAARGFCLNLNKTGVACISSDAVLLHLRDSAERPVVWPSSRETETDGWESPARAERKQTPELVQKRSPRQLGMTDVATLESDGYYGDPGQ